MICEKQHSFEKFRLHVSTVFPPTFNDTATDQTTHGIQLHEAASYTKHSSATSSEQGKLTVLSLSEAVTGTLGDSESPHKTAGITGIPKTFTWESIHVSTSDTGTLSTYQLINSAKKQVINKF